MYIHDATEEAYKNGYDKGYEDGKKDAVARGHWINYDDSGYDNVYGCSECNGIALEYMGLPMLSNYCPNCGKRMREYIEGENNENV